MITNRGMGLRLFWNKESGAGKYAKVLKGKIKNKNLGSVIPLFIPNEFSFDHLRRSRSRRRPLDDQLSGFGCSYCWALKMQAEILLIGSSPACT
jgi:hypothetical protein